MAVEIVMDVGSATATGQLTISQANVRLIEWHARADNTGTIVVGMSDVSASNGRELSPDERVTWNYSELGDEAAPGYILYNKFFIHVNVGGDVVDYTVFLARD